MLGKNRKNQFFLVVVVKIKKNNQKTVKYLGTFFHAFTLIFDTFMKKIL